VFWPFSIVQYVLNRVLAVADVWKRWRAPSKKPRQQERKDYKHEARTTIPSAPTQIRQQQT
jgi:hypothetical protein